jgi:hypothetical protein
MLEYWLPCSVVKRLEDEYVSLAELEFVNKCLICYTAGVRDAGTPEKTRLVCFDKEEDYVVFALRWL